MENKEELLKIVSRALEEDLGDGDHTSNACIPDGRPDKGFILIKGNGIVAGIDLAELVYQQVDEGLEVNKLAKDGDPVKVGDIVMEVSGDARSILRAERVVLNFMQRMSGIATTTHRLTQKISQYKARLLDTRKTTPGIRAVEKWAVRIGGGMNHRMGLYDMVMIKDNHIDFAGGIDKAIGQVNHYLQEKGKNLKIEIEVRDFNELEQVLAIGKVHRIMLDNFKPADLIRAVELIAGRYETEASGGITEEVLESYAATGVDFISMGALTNNVKSLDISLKAKR